MTSSKNKEPPFPINMIKEPITTSFLVIHQISKTLGDQAFFLLRTAIKI
jgi:hypothetical protein